MNRCSHPILTLLDKKLIKHGIGEEAMYRESHILQQITYWLTLGQMAKCLCAAQCPSKEITHEISCIWMQCGSYGSHCTLEQMLSQLSENMYWLIHLPLLIWQSIFIVCYVKKCTGFSDNIKVYIYYFIWNISMGMIFVMWMKPSLLGQMKKKKSKKVKQKKNFLKELGGRHWEVEASNP